MMSLHSTILQTDLHGVSSEILGEPRPVQGWRSTGEDGDYVHILLLCAYYEQQMGIGLLYLNSFGQPRDEEFLLIGRYLSTVHQRIYI